MIALPATVSYSSTSDIKALTVFRDDNTELLCFNELGLQKFIDEMSTASIFKYL